MVFLGEMNRLQAYKVFVVEQLSHSPLIKNRLADAITTLRQRLSLLSS